jgi:hypothetical protein
LEQRKIMRTQPEHEEMLDEAASDSSWVATLEQEQEETSPEQPRQAPEWTGPQCEKCDAPIKSDVVSICRKCGWYASLGTFLEVDPNWETTDEEQAVAAAVPQKSHVRVWLDLIPRWGWVIIASALAVVVESVVARLVTPEGSSLRTAWSLSQLMLGILIALGCHIFNFLVAAAENADFGVMDMILKPVKLWAYAVRSLPNRLWVANSAVCGVVAALMAVLIIGGIPYERFWDWGFKQPPKQNLMGAIMDRAKDLDSPDQTLEEAMGDFAGKAGVDGENVKPQKPRRKVDCVIIGYQTDRDGRLDMLVLATVNGKKLMPVGTVRPEMSEREKSDLLEMLRAIHRHDPFVAAEADAIWVEPKIACRISYGERLKGGMLRDLQWDTLLGAMRMPQ